MGFNIIEYLGYKLCVPFVDLCLQYSATSLIFRIGKNIPNEYLDLFLTKIAVIGVVLQLLLLVVVILIITPLLVLLVVG